VAKVPTNHTVEMNHRNPTGTGVRKSRKRASARDPTVAEMARRENPRR
jgi:hypothetical protein